ncbi:MAG: hypothetical protein ACRDSP_24095 [Pseudonocardiaceae bacterium]
MRAGIDVVVQIAVPFIWLGMVLGISGLETPLRFRAPGITVALGLGIGRLVFRALNAAELVLAVVLTVAVLAGARGPGTTAIAVLIALWVLLVAQVAVLRPRLDRRARRILAGDAPPRSHLHLAYIALEGVKFVLLPVLGVILILGGTR